jgi:predicted  nucleic acid-binding Zn-ribbon protein
MEAGDSSASVAAERDALRVQAAAVAAQQTALVLEEDRLRQRVAALQAQELQLASRLEERRQHLLSLQQQVRTERADLKSERTAVESERAQARSAVLQERNDVIAASENVRRQRERLRALRKRLQGRWRRHWDQRDSEHARRERELMTRDEALARKADALERDRAAFLQSQGRFNGEIEIERRRLQDAWTELSLAQQQWDACLNDEQSRRARAAAELDARALALGASEQAALTRDESLRGRRTELHLEMEGLEARVANSRAKLVAPPRIPSDSGFASSAVTNRSPTDNAGAAVPAVLRRLAADLVDQRRVLLEQWHRLLSVQADWQVERRALWSEVDTAAKRLNERERALSTREKHIDGRSADVDDRRLAVERVRANLESWRARLALREAAFDNERSSLLSEVRACAESATREAMRLREAERRWQEQRSAELAELRSTRARCDEARTGYLQAWQGCQNGLASLVREQRDLAIRALAVEELRSELANRAPNAPAAERRLARLEQRNRVRVEAAERRLHEGHAALQAEIARLREEWQRYQAADAAVRERQDALDRLRGELEKLRSQIHSAADERADDIQRLRAQHVHDVRELSALKQELERIARHLIGDEEDALPEAERQAA